MRIYAVLLVLAGLTGCAGMGGHSVNEAGLTDARAKISLGRCDEGLVADLRRYKAPELEQQAAYVCLQQGESLAVETLLQDYSQRHVSAPYPDYSAYVLALAQLTRFELAADEPLKRLQEGRKAHAQLAGFVRTYPESEYRNEVAPRMHALLEQMAQAEYQLAIQALEQGDKQTGRARMQYLSRAYSQTMAGRDAAGWLSNNLPN